MVRVAITILMLMFVSSVAHAEKRIALLIGNQAYGNEIGRLTNPHNDIALLEKALKGLGFEVTSVRDAGLAGLHQAVNAYARRVKAAGPNTVSFFYYSGHGAADADTNYLIPVDVKTTETGEMWDQSQRLTEITRKLKTEAGNATHFVVFDACRNTLKLTWAGSRALVQSKGFVPVAQESGMLIAYATAEGELASDVGGGAGPYATVLAEETVRPGIEAVTMFRNVQLRVKRTIGQDPWLSFPSLPAVYFAGARPPENVEMTFWASVKDSKSPTILNMYIERYPDGEFAPLARALIGHYERQLQVEQAAREEERRRQEEVRKSAEVKRFEEREQKARDHTWPRASTQEQRLAAVKAAEEAKERAKTTGSASPIPEDVARDREALTRTLKSELARVGCDPGAVDGRWGAKAIEALRQFNRHAKVSLSVDQPTEGALRAIAVIKHPVCILKSAAHQKLSGGRCVSVAKSEQPAPKAGGSTKLCWPGYAPWGPRACTGDPRERPIN